MNNDRGNRSRSDAVALLALALALAGCAAPPPATPIVAAAKPVPPAAHAIVVAANPLAADAGLVILRHGGTAIDAVVAVQAVLGLVEPQSSGPGGGGVLLTWTARDATVRVFDGTPRAGHDALRGLNEDEGGRPLDPRLVPYGGGAVGVPGTLAALWAAHAAQGKLPWADLFAPAIALAETGFPMPRALHGVLAAPGAAATFRAVAAPWLGPGDGVPPVGAVLRNRAYAATLRRVAADGPNGLYAGAALPALLRVLAQGARGSRLTGEDLRGFAATQPPPVCAPWREWRICTAPAPSFGGLVAVQTLAMAGVGDLDDPAYAHRFLEAGRLAQADRRRYLGDPDFVAVPEAGLLDATYLAARAGLIAPLRAMAHPTPGDPVGDAAGADADPGAPTTATSQIVVVDRAGNAVTMTTSLYHVFGARLLAGGMVLNNALANFAPLPPRDSHYANEMAPGKRPAGPLAPVIVLDRAGRPVLLGGSGGGPGVPDFVAQALLDILVHHRTPADALARPHLCAADPDHVALEAGTAAESLAPALAAMGHAVRAQPLPSGSAFVLRGPDGWLGSADPRRDGVARGD